MGRIFFILAMAFCLTSRADDLPKAFDIQAMVDSLGQGFSNPRCPANGKIQSVKSEYHTKDCIVSKSESLRYMANLKNQIATVSHLFKSDSLKCSKSNLLTVFGYPSKFEDRIEQDGSILIWTNKMTIPINGQNETVFLHMACDKAKPNDFSVVANWK